MAKFIRYFIVRNAMKLLGQLTTPGTTEVTVVLADSRGVLLAYGNTVPSDGEAGYAMGCIFIDTNGAAGSVMYANEGSNTSADFNTSLVSGDISAVTTDSVGLVGGASSGAAAPKLGITVKNSTGGTLTKGTLVRVSGYSSGYLVTKADADAGLMATHVLDADISDAASGTAYAITVVTGIDTSGGSVGDPLYLSATAGEFTPTAPTGADQMVQRVGVIVTSHASTGSALFFPGTPIVVKRGSSSVQPGSIVPAALAASEALTATDDGTTTGAMSGNTSHAVVTSAGATKQVSLPASSAALVGKQFTIWVGSNGFELITPAASNATINGTDADGTNQADIPANSLSRLTLVTTNTWLLENIGSTGTVASAIVPDND